eukprot:scaffold228895_cov54-Attheya_sp.AAC.1
MTKHHNMCSRSNCDPEIPARRTARFAENLLFKQCNKEGAKECQKKWAEIAPLLLCKLCNSTVENPRVSPDNNARKQNKNKWHTKEHHENLEPNGKRNEHKKAIYIFTMCMSDNWEILEPSKWLRSAIKTVTLLTQSGRVWRRKFDGNIKVYHKTVDKHLETAETHFKAIRSTPEHDRKRSLDLLETTQRQRLKVLIEKQSNF